MQRKKYSEFNHIHLKDTIWKGKNHLKSQEENNKLGEYITQVKAQYT